MSRIGQSPGPAETTFRKCARCGRFKSPSADDLCPRCAPLDQKKAADLVEASLLPERTIAEQAVLHRRAREEFVIARPSQLRSGRVVAPAMRVAGISGAARGASETRDSGDTVRARLRPRSRIRTAIVTAVLVLVGAISAAAIPLVLSLLGS